MIRARPAGLKPARDWLAEYAGGWDFSFNKLDELIKKELGEDSHT